MTAQINKTHNIPITVFREVESVNQNSDLSSQTNQAKSQKQVETVTKEDGKQALKVGDAIEFQHSLTR